MSQSHFSTCALENLSLTFYPFSFPLIKSSKNTKQLYFLIVCWPLWVKHATHIKQMHVLEGRFCMAYCLKWMFWIILFTCTDGFLRGFPMKSQHYFILFKRLTNNYETRSVWFSLEEIFVTQSQHSHVVFTDPKHMHMASVNFWRN